ncbi:NAD(P)H-dependent glycerol-3-phosphate dehydrogenase [Jannaschia sp. 2305UL9-9]|uniref:NAD(P)H-dependent glycerol-3-phosphate dehydrogenase n=1 Tax=Jannaschia sp. 2305UL9-9 TaxID=3121638 RepID=UPI003528643B
MIGVLGAGAFGTALALALAHREPVHLWGRDADTMARIAVERTTPRLPGVTLPGMVTVTGDIAALSACRILLLAVPMQALGDLMPALTGLRPEVAVAACKGIDLTTLRGPTALIADGLPQAIPAILSGPSFAADIARGLPTALSLGCADDGMGREVQHALSTPVLRLYRTTDVAGVEAGGALKNVIAIACGAAIGAGLGDSARAALMTRGMAEMQRLAGALGARPETLMGLSGLGDLALTCASPASRNFALGLALGRGDPRPAATTEGVATADAALRLAAERGLDLPVTEATAGLVAGRLTVKDAMTALLTRDLKTEVTT